MTEAVCLALIALVGELLHHYIATQHVKNVLKHNPTHILIDNEFGYLEAEFDTEADE